ncbi:MAG TPA: TIGR03435 family protein [Acidobacteriaceae bacterium]|nr:TIGR03435 family protein [Acidobacteriaceae bacterium]
MRIRVGHVWAMVVAVVLCAAGAVRAQDAGAQQGKPTMMAKDADPDWDAVTVKPSDSDDTDSGFQVHGRQIVMERESVESMVGFGYGIHAKQIAGAPDWAGTERWNIEGVPNVQGQPNMQQYETLVRKILAERFRLKVHTETRELPVYALRVAKDGPKIAKTAGDPNGKLDMHDRINGGQRRIQVTNGSIADIALVLKFYTDRPLVDQTGLKGRYDFQLAWTFDEMRAPTDGSAAPSLFTAIQEDMGLKLEPVKAPVDVLVIDKVERPGAN